MNIWELHMMTENNENTNNESDTLEDFIQNRQKEWTSIVTDLNKKLSKLAGVNELMYTLYTERQKAVEYYYTLLNKISKLSQAYKIQYAQKYNAYKVSSNIRYNSDAAINAQIMSDLSDSVYTIELMNNFSKFMQETVKTIDNIIYAIQNRIKIEELIQGYK